MADQNVSDVVEEYLETIYRLQEKEGNGARTNDIVRTLKVVPGTVTNTIERLEREGYVNHRPYRGVRLTEKGRKIAVQVVRRHRLSERLLTDLLHVNWGKAHDVACKIEHDIADEEIMGSIEKALGEPKTCPHGNPIPGQEGEFVGRPEETIDSRILANLDVSEEGRIVRVVDENVEMLQYLSNLGLFPGVLVKVESKEPVGGLITIRVGGSAVHTISTNVASAIWVKMENGAKGQKTQKLKVQGGPTVRSAYGDYEH
jgi:DtxR family Mn-dependent transcriptional regulator